MTKTLKTPQILYRQGEVEKKEDNVLTLSISSEDPYLRYDWWNDEEYYEVLSHKESDMDMARLKSGAALLFNHDRNQQLGTITQPKIKDGRCYVQARLSDAPDCESFRVRIKEGILKDTSVGYSLTGDAEKIGEKDGKPIYKFAWQPHEASLVTIAADPSVGIGRERDHKPSGEPKEILVEVEHQEEQPKRVLDAIAKVAKPDGKPKAMPEVIDPPKPDVDVTRERGDAVKLERERQAKIKEHCAEVKKRTGKEAPAVAERFLTGDKAPKLGANETDLRESFSEFQSEYAIEAFKAARLDDTPSGIEVIGDRAQGPMNGGRIIAPGSGGIGRMFSGNKKYKDHSGSRQKNFSVDIPEFSSFRATAATTTITNFNGIVQVPNIIELGVQMATVADLLSQGTTNLAAIPYLREDTITNAATIVAEGAAKPEASWDWSQTSAVVKKIAVTAKVSDELFADVPSIESYINSRLRWMVEIAEDAALLTGADLPGILQTAGIQTIAQGGDTELDAIRKGITKVQSVGFFQPDGIVMHPTDWEQISLMKDANNQYYAGGPFYAPYGQGQYIQFFTLWGLKVVVTTAMTVDTVLVGAFRLGAMIFRRTGLTIDSTNSNEDDFEKNLITLRAEERLALAVWRPTAFCTVTGI